MTERWVINASPLILLGKAGQLGWVPRLGKIVVPSPVADEILAGAENDPARLWLAASAAGRNDDRHATGLMLVNRCQSGTTLATRDGRR